MNVKPNKLLQIPFGTIHITDYARKLINQALDETKLSCGTLVKEFEDKFAALHGVKEAVAVATGTDADTLALAVLHDFGAKRGDEVIIPALSFVATGNSVLHAGFTPVFVDINRKTLNIDPDQIEKTITESTRAIMPVHLMGKPAEMDKINALAKKYDLCVVEDAAEAHGAKYKGKPTGTLGDMGAFSTYVAHIISTIEGGVVTTDREDYAEIIRSLRSHGRSCTCKACIMNSGSVYCDKRFGNKDIEDIRFIFNRVGYSCKMNELEAAIGLDNIQNYDAILQKRYSNLKQGMKIIKAFEPYLYTIDEEQYEKIGPHALPIIISNEASFTRRDLINFLGKHYIDSRTLFNSIPTQCPGFEFLGHKLGDFENAEFIGNNGIHIGVHQDIESAHIEYLTQVLNTFMEKYQK
ncbi:MAG: DegT/DnrJ/EryC1/StrS family aminotransferase [Victivallaceae bacterium]|jgi:dTDP-4-amino-4,6-dideoxygalactose transaminase